MSVDITKYKDWYWCESSGIYNDYFAEIEGTEELPIEIAKELITDCDDLIPIEGKPNHYHKCRDGHIGFIDYVIYAFKDESVFRQVVEKFEYEIDLDNIFKYFQLSRKEFLDWPNGNNADYKQFTQCAQWLCNFICDLDEDYGISAVPTKYQKIFKISRNILRDAEKNIQNKTIIELIDYYIERDKFLHVHNFKNLIANNIIKDI